MTDRGRQSIRPFQCRLGRNALEWSQRDLSQKARVAFRTLSNFEQGQQVQASCVARLRAALEAGGVIFVEEFGDGPGVRLRNTVETGQLPAVKAKRKQAVTRVARELRAGSKK